MLDFINYELDLIRHLVSLAKYGTRLNKKKKNRVGILKL